MNAGEDRFHGHVEQQRAAGTGTAKSVTLSDPLPLGLTWSIQAQPAGNPCSIAADARPGQMLSCAFGDLALGVSRAVTVTATTSFAACATYPNQATASATNHTNVSANASIVCQKPALSITKTAANSPMNAGEDAVFTVTVSNSGAAGTGTAKSVTLSDPLPWG